MFAFKEFVFFDRSVYDKNLGSILHTVHNLHLTILSIFLQTFKKKKV